MPMRGTEDAMAELTIRTIEGQNAKQKARHAEGLMERDEQIRIEVQGTAREFSGWQYADIYFETQFEDATGQRDADFDRPHFTFGGSCLEGGPVAFNACVVEWFVTDTNATVGCRLAIGVASSDVIRTFRGELHATFQGYGAPADVYGDLESLDLN